MKKTLNCFVILMVWAATAFGQTFDTQNLRVHGTTTLINPLTVGNGGTGASTATGATSNLQYLQGATGSAARSVTSRLQDTISFADFNPDPTDTLDSTAAFNNFRAAVLASGKCGHMPAGTYKITAALTIDLASISPKGICLYGDGQYSTMLDLSTVSASPAVQIIDTGNAGGGAFYSSFRDFGIKCNIAGTCLQLGKTDTSDALNEFEFRNLWVGNNSTSASAIGIQVNYVLNTHFFAVIAANNGHGDAWQINAGAFNIWAGGSGTYADNGYHLTANGTGCNCGTIAGNTFTGIDWEVNTVNNVKIDTVNAHNNTFIGGTMVYAIGTSYGVYASAGAENVFTGVFVNPTGGTASISNFFNGANSTGIALVNMFGTTFGVESGNPSFSAYLSTNQTLTSGTWTQIQFNTTAFSNNGAFNTGSYNFVAPWGGRFEFECTLNTNATNASAATAYAGLYRNGSNVRARGSGIPGGTNFIAPAVHAILVLSAGDTVGCWGSIPASSGSPSINGGSTNSFFEGKYLGP